MLIFSFFLFVSMNFPCFHSTNQIEFRACCNSGAKTEKCTKFNETLEMLSSACCGQRVYNTRSHLCCDGEVHQRNRGGVMAHSCCGSQPLRLDQTCCKGVIHNIISGSCCGADVYLSTDSTLICCDDVLSTKSNPDDVCCGKASYDNGKSQQCCNQKVIFLKDFDSCCALNNGKQVEFDSNSHVCCDGPLEKLSKIKSCCYLRSNSTFINTQYDKRKQCCKYPFDKLYEMPKNGSCF